MTLLVTPGSLTDLQKQTVELALDKKFEKIFDAINRRDETEIATLLAGLEMAHAGRCGCSAPYFADAQNHRYWWIRHNLEPQYNWELWSRLDAGMMQLVRRPFLRLMRDDSLKAEDRKDLELKFETFLTVNPDRTVWFALPEQEDYVPHAA